jgi:hypothetical protein
MVEIVNLNRYRKAKAKAAEDVKASNNRLLFGRSRPEKDKEKKILENIKSDLDGKKLEE